MRPKESFTTSVGILTSEHQALGSGLIGGKNEFKVTVVWRDLISKRNGFQALLKCHPFVAKLLQLVIHTPS